MQYGPNRTIGAATRGAAAGKSGRDAGGSMALANQVAIIGTGTIRFGEKALR